MDILVASKSMSMFVMDPASQAVLRYAETHPHCTNEQLTDALVAMLAEEHVLAGSVIVGRWVDVRDPDVLQTLQESVE